MNNIKWKLKMKYARGSKVYECEKNINIRSNEFLFKGLLLVAHAGRGTACVTLERWYLRYNNYRFGFQMIKHFKGHNASHGARAWFRRMIRNCPDFISMIEEEITDTSREQGISPD